MPEAPYYESRYIRANHPDRPQALWLRETLLLPTAGDPVADVWVMVFDPDGAGNRALKEPYPIDAADYDYDNWTARIGATIHRRPVGAGRGDRRKPFGALGSADHAGPRGARSNSSPSARTRRESRRPRRRCAIRWPQFDGPARARRRPARARRLDRQRQPQLGHPAHPGLRVRPGVRLRRRARLEPGDRDGTRRDRTDPDARGHAVRVPPRRGRSSRSARSSAACRPTAGTGRSHGRSAHASGIR